MGQLPSGKRPAQVSPHDSAASTQLWNVRKQLWARTGGLIHLTVPGGQSGDFLELQEPFHWEAN